MDSINEQTCLIAIPAIAQIAVCRKTAKHYVKKTFQFTTVCKGDMNRHKPKTAKITSGLNLGLYHHVLNSSCPYKASLSE